MKVLNVLRADGMRWFCRGRMWSAIIGIIASNYLMLGQDVAAISSVNIVEIVYLYTDDPFLMLSLMLAGTVMGTSYCDERERGYLYFCMQRCSQKQYVVSKMLHVFFSAFFVLTAGIFLWICSMRFLMPWTDSLDDYFYTIASNGIGELLLQKKYLLYFFWHSVGNGMLGGVTAITAFLLSILLRDKNTGTYCADICVLY